MSCERLVVMKTAHHDAQGKPEIMRPCPRDLQLSPLIFCVRRNTQIICMVAQLIITGMNGQLCVFCGGEGYCCNCNEPRRLGTFYARFLWHRVAEMLLAMWFFLSLF